MVRIDNKNYKATWLEGFEQTADILNGDGSGRLQGTAKMYLEYKGTFFNHTGQLRRDTDCTDREWDELFLVLANPINQHTGVFPFGENQTLTQEVYISQIKRKLHYFKDTNKWERIYSVTFTAISPAWTPGGIIKGVE